MKNREYPTRIDDAKSVGDERDQKMKMSLILCKLMDTMFNHMRIFKH